MSSVVDKLRALGLGVSSNSVDPFELNVQDLLAKDLANNRSCSEFGVGDGEFSDSDSVDPEIFERKALEQLCGDLMKFLMGLVVT